MYSCCVYDLKYGEKENENEISLLGSQVQLQALSKCKLSRSPMQIVSLYFVPMEGMGTNLEFKKYTETIVN